MTRKKRGQDRFSWWTDGSALGLLGGFGVTYLAFVPLANHPLHWLLSAFGALAGYVAGLLFSARHGLMAGVKGVLSLVRRGPPRSR